MQIKSRDELFKLFKKKARNQGVSMGCRCSEGHAHDSREEARYCIQLHILKRHEKQIKTIVTHKQFDLCVNGKKICGHQPDFLITYKDGRQEIHEYKGFENDVWHYKRKLFEALYPDIPYVVVRKKDLWA